MHRRTQNTHPLNPRMSWAPRLLVGLAAAALLLSACGGADSSVVTANSTPTSGDTVRLLTYDSYAISDKTLEEFKKETGQEVEIVKAGDAGAMVNRALLSAANPEGDVLFGIDNNLSSRGIDGDLFIPYQPAAVSELPTQLRANTDERLTPIDTGDVCINYDTSYFLKRNATPPQTLADLTKSEYKDQLVVQNPGSSTPGLAFLLATVAEFGPDDFTEYWDQLKENGVLVEESWSTAYEQQFSGSSGGGKRPIVVSYASSPAAEVIFASEPTDTAPTAAALATCYRQIEYAGVLSNTPNETGARQFVDFMLTKRYQADILLNNFVYPVLPGVERPEEFEEFAPQPSDPMALPSSEVAMNRKAWVGQWASVMQS
jgi:thiamine transport system substrate-binding protein